MAIFVPRFLRQLRDVLLSAPADGEVLAYDSADSKWKNAAGGAGGGAPDDATYLVTTAHADLSAEVVVGATPGGELGGTWASPTVDATHSGSSHASVQGAAEATAAAALLAHTTDSSDAHDASAISSVAAGSLAATDVQAALNELDTEKAAAAHAHAGEDVTSGTVADARIAATIARDSEVAAGDATVQGNLDAHTGDATDAHDASAISILDAAADFTATEVEGALAELQTADEADEAALAAHLADTTSVHGITDTSTLYRSGGTDVAVADGGTGAGTAAGARTNLGLEIAARAFHSANQALANDTVVSLALDSERFDTDTIHDAATNNSRLTCKTAGKYLISGNVEIAASVVGVRMCRILLNGTTQIAKIVIPPLSAGAQALAVTCLYELAVNDYVEFQAYQNSGGSLNALSSANYSPEFSMVKVA